MNSIIKRTHAALFGGADPSPSPPPAVSDFGEVEILEVATPQPFPSSKTPSAAGQSGPQSKHTCVFKTCSRHTHAFGTAKDLRRHITNVHHLTEAETVAKILERDSGSGNGTITQTPTSARNTGMVGNDGERNKDRQPREPTNACIFIDCPRHKAEFATRNHLKRHLYDVHKLSEDEMLAWMPKNVERDDKANETGLQDPAFVGEKPASENPFPSSSKTQRVIQEPRPVIDLRCLLRHCPGHAGHYSSLKNLKRHWQDVHKLSPDEIASRVAERENAEFGSDEETAVPILEKPVASTPEAAPKRKKIREAVHKCVFEECPRSSEGFGERYDLKRHLSTVHKMSTEDAAKTVAQYDGRREEVSIQSSNMILDSGSSSGEFRLNSNPSVSGSKKPMHIPRSSLSAIHASSNDRDLHADYGRENPETMKKLANDMNKREEYTLRMDKGNKEGQQFPDDQDDGILYPETIDLPENRTAACPKIQSMAIVRRIKLRSGKVLRGLAKGQANLESAMGQQRGEVMEGEDACRHCQLSRGPFEECVVIPGMLNHSCTNCHYNSEGSRCSFRPTYEDSGPRRRTAETDELAIEDSPALDASKYQLSRKRRSIEEPSIEDDEPGLEDENLEPYTPQYYTAQYARISEEDRLQEESVLHMRLSCLAQARIQNLAKRRGDSEQYEESYNTPEGRPKGKRARRSH